MNPIESITLSDHSLHLTKGEQFNLSATILPEDASDKSVVWKSTNEQVCFVSQTGLIVATGDGTAVVTVITNDGGKSDYCTVEVGGDGIMEIQRGSSDISPIYDTMGRKVKALTKGQLYISNGKKFICR